MPYIPNTNKDRAAMLKRIGVDNFESLLDGIPDGLRLNRELAIKPLSELELMAEMNQLAGNNNEQLVCFAGGGVYDHFIPSAVGSIVSRPEFATAYTPYQPEVSQGTLQVIYEFQTHICRLTGMDVANASMYDGATAAAEAVILTTKLSRRSKVIISETVNPIYRQVIKTYLSGRDVELVTIPMTDGLTDTESMLDAIDNNTAGVLIGQPNFFGILEEVEPIEKKIHEAGGKLVLTIDPVAQAIIKTAADFGADIVVGEGQPFGNAISFGGPLLGFFAAKKELARQLPGRIAARTKDIDGKTGFVLTLQTREQHIRREKATSNICTNQALCATAAAVYLSLLGKSGLKKVALLSAERARSAARQIFELDGFEPYFNGPFVREFTVKTPRPASEIIMAMIKQKILPGIDAGRFFPGLDDCLILATTEMRTEEQIARLTEGLKELNSTNVLSRM